MIMILGILQNNRNAATPCRSCPSSPRVAACKMGMKAMDELAKIYSGLRESEFKPAYEKFKSALEAAGEGDNEKANNLRHENEAD